MNPLQRPILNIPCGVKKVLLHSCCAPCSGEIMEAMIASGIEFTVFFYNPSIHPRYEYENRKNENISYAQKKNIPFVDADYDTSNWFARIEGLEMEPEKGRRCKVCFDIRLERTALYAKEYGFNVFTSSLGISRWKDMMQVNGCGVKAASRYPGMIYWTYNWRKNGGAARKYEIAKRENFYQQEYCGCVYSLRDSNLHRASKGQEQIEIGKKFYGSQNLVQSEK